MIKIGLLSITLFLSTSVIAQSNLVIDNMRIPVRVVEQTTTLKKGKDITLKIPHGKSDTIISWDPETYGEQIEIITTGPATSPIQVRDIGQKVKRSQFLQDPLLILSHNGLDYTPYKFHIYFIHNDQYIEMGFDNWELIGPTYSLPYLRTRTLPDFEQMLKKKLPKDVSEIYISRAAFYSPDNGERIFLKDGFKIVLKE